MKVSVEKIRNVFWIVIAFLMLFTYNTATYNLIRIPLPVTITYPIELVILLVIFFVMLNVGHVRVDVLFILMFFRTLLFTVGFLVHENSIDNIPRYLAVILWPLIYSIMCATPFDEKKKENILKFAELTCLIISIQSIISSLRALTSGMNVDYVKNYMRIPIAPSNTITCYLLLILPFVFFLEEKKTRKYLLTLVALLAILLTRSMSGIMVSFILVLFALNEQKRYRVFKAVIVIIVAIGAVMVINSYMPTFFQRYINRFVALLTGGSEVALNGRIQLYSQGVELAKDVFPWGYGVSYMSHLNDNLVHNWIIETFLQEGLLNFILVISIFVICFTRLYVNRKNIVCKSALISLILVLIQAMVEPSITAFTFDFFFITFVSVGLNCCGYKHYSNVRKYE